KDYDLDGKPELMLAYGYHGPTLWAVGDVYYKHWCIINLDTLALGIHVVLDVAPQATTTQAVESKWKLVGTDVQIVRREGEWDEGKGERVWRERTTVYRYDEKKDGWVSR